MEIDAFWIWTENFPHALIGKSWKNKFEVVKKFIEKFLQNQCFILCRLFPFRQAPKQFQPFMNSLRWFTTLYTHYSEQEWLTKWSGHWTLENVLQKKIPTKYNLCNTKNRVAKSKNMISRDCKFSGLHSPITFRTLDTVLFRFLFGVVVLLLLHFVVPIFPYFWHASCLFVYLSVAHCLIPKKNCITCYVYIPCIAIAIYKLSKRRHLQVSALLLRS